MFLTTEEVGLLFDQEVVRDLAGDTGARSKYSPILTIINDESVHKHNITFFHNYELQQLVQFI